MPKFHSPSTNISWITNLNFGAERACKTAQSAYSSCPDKIRTQILNCSQRSRNSTVGTVVQFQPGQIPTVQCPVRVTTPARQSGSAFWMGLDQDGTGYPVQTRTAGRLPGPVANTMYWSTGYPWFAKWTYSLPYQGALTVSPPGVLVDSSIGVFAITSLDWVDLLLF